MHVDVHTQSWLTTLHDHLYMHYIYNGMHVYNIIISVHVHMASMAYQHTMDITSSQNTLINYINLKLGLQTDYLHMQFVHYDSYPG